MCLLHIQTIGMCMQYVCKVVLNYLIIQYNSNFQFTFMNNTTWQLLHGNTIDWVYFLQKNNYLGFYDTKDIV